MAAGAAEGGIPVHKLIPGWRACCDAGHGACGRLAPNVAAMVGAWTARLPTSAARFDAAPANVAAVLQVLADLPRVSACQHYDTAFGGLADVSLLLLRLLAASAVAEVAGPRAPARPQLVAALLAVLRYMREAHPTAAGGLVDDMFRLAAHLHQYRVALVTGEVRVGCSRACSNTPPRRAG
jgi:hypothetical protein